MTAPAPDSVELAEAAAGWRFAYVHVPFCRRRCPYCDFAVVTPGEAGALSAVDTYVDAVVAEVVLEPPWDALDGVNFGGGTPSTLDPASIATILDALRDQFGLRPHPELSIEANPEDWTDRLGSELVAAGVTRISMGVQSFDGDVLGSLGRLHTPEQATAAVAGAMASGLESVSLDLIYGTPGESMASWVETVGRALSLQPDHLSAYALTVERGTRLARDVRDGAPAPDPDDQADKYAYLATQAAAAGLVRYEVSNFARPGHVCRYNLATWGQGDYVAFGLGAHGHRDGIRRRNVRRLDRYLTELAAGRRPESGRDHIAGWPREQERLMLGLRRSAGVASGEIGRRLAESLEGGLLVAVGLLELREDRLVVSDPMLTDEVTRSVLSLSPADC